MKDALTSNSLKPSDFQEPGSVSLHLRRDIFIISSMLTQAQWTMFSL